MTRDVTPGKRPSSPADAPSAASSAAGPGNASTIGGASIGPFTVGAQLNKGGMGMVFRAQKRLGNGEVINVAIKFPRLSVVHDPDIVQGFFNEAEVMSKFRSSRIPKIDTWGLHEGMPYVVMELISGVSLQQLLERLWDSGRSLSFDLAAHILREVALALNYAHTFSLNGRAKHILHRDLSAKNVMIGNSGDVYLIDFGVVRSADTQHHHRSSANVVKGTLNYLAPEHAAGDPCAASDVFGLHTILWEMIEGRVFRGGRSEKQLWSDALQGHVPPITRTEVPAFLTELLQRGLHPDPERRVKLTDAIALLEEQSKPRTLALKSLFARLFDRIARRSGSTIVDGVEVASELLKTMAAAKAAQSPQPRSLERSPLPGASAPEPPSAPSPAPPSDPPPTAEVTAPPRPRTDPGVPLALRTPDHERPPSLPPAPADSGPHPSSSPGPAKVLSTALLDPSRAPDPRDARGHTLPLLDALPPTPSTRPTPPPTRVPTPPPTQPELGADSVPGVPLHSVERGSSPTLDQAPSAGPADTRFYPAPPRGGRWRWLWFTGGAVLASALAGVVAMLIIDSPPAPTSAVSAQPPAQPAPVPAPQPAPAASLEIPEPEPSPPEPEPKPEPAPKAQPEPAPKAQPEPTPEAQPALAPRTQVTLRPGFTAAEVRIGGGKVLSLSRTRTVRVRTGQVVLRWRFPPETTWHKKTLRLRPRQNYVVLVERSGLRVSSEKP